MASDQMLPNSSTSSKKQQQLEAGKRRLEEFRKKKAAAKKAASNNSVNGDLHEIKPSVSDTPDVTDSTSDKVSEQVRKNEKKKTDIQETEPHSMYASNPNPNPVTSFNKPSANPRQTNSTDGNLHHVPKEELKNSKLGFNGGYGVDSEKSKTFHHSENDNHINSSNNFSNTRLEDAFRNSKDDHLKDVTSTNPFTSQVSNNKSSSVNNSSHIDQRANGSTYRDSLFEVGKSIQSSSESISTNFRYDSVPVPVPVPASVSVPATGLPTRRSRPSFLDSILPSEETDKAVNPFSSKVHPVDATVSSQNFINSSSVPNIGDGGGGAHFRRNSINDFDMERNNNNNNNYNSTKQNEDFAALEQHIEDLTQEKFSLQRALEASRVLAESLATENSALTDTYNQQGGVVNQLKLDMERLQEEIKAQLVELEAMRTEYGNAMLECSAADERAKLLASEVIGLEEKALRLRSNELKLERQLENMEAEMSSQKRKISSMEKDRQDLQSTIEALQEEKKMMQSKLRKAPVITNSVEIKKPPPNRKEVSTSTDDLDESEEETTSNLAVLATVGDSDATSQSRYLGFEVSSSSIPPDQTKMIQNIQTLISELALEKEELVRALSTESSRSSKLRDLNNELSHKLEVQTQRLELLTSQSMVSDNNNNNNNIPTRKPGTRTVVDNAPYADEGDEVVERVLGWIMKLFPGGPSRRQTKHL